MNTPSQKSTWTKTLLLALLALGIYAIGAMLFTSWYTRHGQSIQVPKVVGMPFETAEEVLDDNDLEMVIIDSVYDEDQKPNTIVEQDPAFDSKVKPGRKVYVSINTGIKPKVRMPKLINGSSNLAKVLLQNVGLRLGKIDSVKSAFGPGLVIKQRFNGHDIAPNVPLDKGSIIDIVVSKKLSLADTAAVQMLNDGVVQDNPIQ
jgi:beta-lactam-binding protein with PASTA domain